MQKVVVVQQHFDQLTKILLHCEARTLFFLVYERRFGGLLADVAGLRQYNQLMTFFHLLTFYARAIFTSYSVTV